MTLPPLDGTLLFYTHLCAQVGLQPRPKLAVVPKNVPITKSLHVVRCAVEDEVCMILGGDEPATAALTGRSGAGKTTTAAAMVGERQGPVRCRNNETEDQARTRLNRVRALFPDGVVWLRVGKGEGLPDRLPPLMLKLAQALHKDVLKMCVRGPGVGEDGESYVKRIVEQKSLRCLVVADDVWESEVVDKLRKTGMWVLLTTRRAESTVGAEQRVVVDKLTELEAEDVLRGAAELPQGERLCDDAMKVLEICEFVAMDIALVGSWTSVRTTNGIPKTKKAWARTVGEIEAQIDHVRDQGLVGNAGGMGDLDRLAVLRAGFKYLGIQDPLAQPLYVALAVFPDGYSFGTSDAAVLLDDGEVAMGLISILERWGILREDISGRYRLHDAHVDFARDKLMGWEHVRQTAVDRWTSHISRMEFAVSIDVHVLLNIWQVLEQVEGKGWFDTRPYDDQLISIDTMDHSKMLAVHVVAELYGHDRKFCERDAIMKKVLEQCDGYPGGCVEVQMAALYFTRNSLRWQGRWDESIDVERRLGEVIRPDLQLQLPFQGTGVVQKSMMFSLYAVCAKATRRYKDAEEWFRKVLKAEEDGGRAGSYQMCWVMFELGLCAREAGRPGEAEELLKRALETSEIKMGPESLEVAAALHELGRCLREARRPGEAEELLERALEIFEIKSGADDPQVAQTLYELGLCVREAGRPGEAEELLKRALNISGTRRGSDDLQAAYTLRELGRYARQAGQAGEAEELLKPAGEIEEANFGANDPQLAVALCSLGLNMRDVGRQGEAEELFRRALEIKEAKLGADDPQLAATMHEVGVCMLEVGRLGEAEAWLRRALEIKEAKLGTHDPQVAFTLQKLGRCVRAAGRPGDAEALLRRALEIKEAEWGSDDPEVSVVLGELSRCVWEVGRPEEAEALCSRAWDIAMPQVVLCTSCTSWVGV